LALAETARDVEFPGGSLGFLVYFVALWVGVTALLGVLSGWPTLAKQFRAAARPSGTRLIGHVFRIGLVPEGRVTGLVVAAQGLYLWTLWPFRLLRPPLLIPWTALQVRRERRILWWRRFTFGTSAGVDIVLSGKAYDAIRPFLTRR